MLFSGKHIEIFRYLQFFFFHFLYYHYYNIDYIYIFDVNGNYNIITYCILLLTAFRSD